MLKGRKPNKHILKPLNMPIHKELDAPINLDLVECEKQNTGESTEFNENYEVSRNDASYRYNNNKRLHDSYVKDITDSQ